MKGEEQARKINKVIAKAWMDEEFKKRLLSNPRSVLGEEGVEVPPDTEVRVAEETHGLRYFVLPRKPSAQQVSEEVLSKVVSGGCDCGPGCAPTDYQCGGGTYNCASGFCTSGGWCGF